MTTQNSDTQNTVVEAPVKGVGTGELVRLREGASVWMDFNWWTWPDLPHATLETAFHAEPTKNDKSKLTANFFGLFPPHGAYGSGAIYANNTDLLPNTSICLTGQK